MRSRSEGDGSSVSNDDEDMDACAHTPYFYDKSTPPSFVEGIFGEPYHVGEEYASHQITVRLLLCIMCQSIVTGSITWLQIAIRYYLIEKWSVGPSQFAGILSMVQIPFTIRLLYGLLIDSVPLFGYRRKSYLFLFGCVGVAASFALICYHHSLATTICCVCIRSFAVAFCDVILSAVTVERSESKSHSVAMRLQSFNYFCMYVVSGIGLMVAAHIEQSQQPHDIVHVYWIYFALTFLIIVASVLLPEQRPSAAATSTSSSSSLYRRISLKFDKSQRGITQLPGLHHQHQQQEQEEEDNEEELQRAHRHKYDYTLYSVHDSLKLSEKRVADKLPQKERQQHIQDDDDHTDNDLLRMMQFFEEVEQKADDDDCRPESAELDAMMRLHDGERRKYSLSQIVELTFESFCRKSLFYPILFTFLMCCMPRSNQAIDYFLMYELGFDSNQISSLQLVASFAFIVSVALITLYSRRSADKFSLRSLFAVWTCIGAVIPYFTLILVFGLNRSVLHISDFLFVVIDTLLIRITTDILLLATAVLYARICPPGIEGLFFTFLTSVATLGEILSYAMSAFFINVFDIQCSKIYYHDFNGLLLSGNAADGANVVCDFGNLWLLIITINLTTLVPLLWIFWIPNEEEMNQISVTLRQSAMRRLQRNDDDEHDRSLTDMSNVNEQEMIALYFVARDYLFPCLKHCIFATCIKAKEPNKARKSKMGLIS